MEARNPEDDGPNVPVIKGMSSMLTFAWYFWPVLWSVIGGGAVLTVALCLIVARVPAPHLGTGVHRIRAHRARRQFRLAHRHAHA
jgi:hypothetical protein